jgi:hypothetical protein
MEVGHEHLSDEDSLCKTQGKHRQSRREHQRELVDA